MLEKTQPILSDARRLTTRLETTVLRHDAEMGLSALLFADGELRVPRIDAAVGALVEAAIDARDVSIALSRPMDVSILNRLPGTILRIEHLALPYVRVTFSLGVTELDALITKESVERLALVEGLQAWAMIKAVALTSLTLDAKKPLRPRRWPPAAKPRN